MSAASESTRIPVCISQLEIRRMRMQDVPDVMAIESVSFGRHHWADESFYNELNNHVGRYYSLMDAETGRAIGYLGMWLIADESHFTTLAVHPDYRGNSLGELMLMHGIDRCFSSSIHWITLEVRVGNYSAQNLYYKHGFNSMGTRPKYYQDNQEDALIMTTPAINSEDYRSRYKALKARFIDTHGELPNGFGQS